MVARPVVKPTQKDSLKRLVAEVRKPRTGAHGVKFAGLDAGTVYAVDDTTMLLWDGPTAMEWRNDIDQGQADLAAARETLAQTAAKLLEAENRITENGQVLAQADQRASEAALLAESTAGKLTSVESNLTTTATGLQSLQGKFSAVETAANTASTAASNAYSAAQSAQQTAEATASNFNAMDAKLTAALAAKPGMIQDSSFELPEMWEPGFGATIGASPAARAGSNVLTLPWTNYNGAGGSVHAYSRQDKTVKAGSKYRFTAYLRGAQTAAANEARANFVFRKVENGARIYLSRTAQQDLAALELTDDGWTIFQADWEAPADLTINAGIQARGLTADLLVDDFQMVDATAEASLQLAVADAKQEAEEAAKAAQAANIAAGLAQKSADGKSTITASTSDPSGLGVSVGDIHQRLTSLTASGQVVGQWRWNGSAWVSQQISSDFIANLGVTKLTGTFANFTQHLNAGAITTPYLTIGIGANVVPNGGGQAQGGWENFGHDTSGPTQNNGYPGSFWVLGQSTKRGPRFPITPGEWGYTVSGKGQHTGGRVYVQLNFYDNAGGRTTGPYIVSNQVLPNGSWADFSGKVTVPAGVVEADILIYANHSNGVVADDYQWFTGFSLKEYVPGSLVVNGSITGDQINAEDVAAKVGRFVEVQAVNVEVTEDFSARVANVMTTNTKRLVVTGDAVIQHAKLLGTTVAEEFHVRKLLRGRDAILDGTLDVAQLNVTNEFSSTVVNTLTVNAKRAFFTEGMTSAESTLLGTTIAERINAGEVASRIMTGGLLQTTAASNRGVKINNQGIRAWNGSGTQTLQINGTDNFMTGEFSTAPRGQRVKISNSGSIAAIDLYASRSTDDHVGMWYDSPDTNALNSVGRILAISGSSYTRNSPGLEMWPMRGTFGFRGRWQQETDATKFVEITNSTGLAAGAWAQLTIPYQTAFPTNNSLRLPVVSVERLYGADVIVNIVTESASSITLLVVNKSTSGTSGPIKVRAAVFNLNA